MYIMKLKEIIYDLNFIYVKCSSCDCKKATLHFISLLLYCSGASWRQVIVLPIITRVNKLIKPGL